MLIDENEKPSFSLQNAFSPPKRRNSGTSKNSNNSIAKDYLLRTNKKGGDADRDLAIMSQSILSNNINQGGNMSYRHKSSGRMVGPGKSQHNRDGTRRNSPQKSSNKDPFLHHVLKQINSLKVENLELKKMINERVCSQGRPKSQQSQRKVSISIDNDLEPIHSLRSMKKSKTPKDPQLKINFNNESRAKSQAKQSARPFIQSRNRSDVSHISKGTKKSTRGTKKSVGNSKMSANAQKMYINKYSQNHSRRGSRDPVTTFQR